MAETFRTDIGYSSQTTVALDLGTGSSTGALSAAVTLTEGTGINQANRKFEDTRTLTATTAETIDIFDFGGVTDPHGRAYTLSKVRKLIIKNTSTTAANLLKVGGEGTAAAWNSPFGGDDTSLLVVEPGGILVLEAPSAAGYAVADTSNHLLKIENMGSTSTIYNIIVVGSQA